jgi:hypothetical protein
MLKCQISLLNGLAIVVFPRRVAELNKILAKLAE